MSATPIEVTILPDGSVKIETDKVSEASHVRAERFVAELQKLLGGETVRAKRTHGHHHQGAHEHDHDHGHDHTHEDHHA